MPTHISINSTVFSTFPELRIHGLVLRNLDISAINKLPSTDWPDIDETQADRVIERWKKIYKSFPCDKKARCSIEYLTQAVKKGKLRSITPLIDLYNSASLIALSPFGGEDIPSLQGALTLSSATGKESFTPLGKDQIETPLAGEIIWVDKPGRVVCRSINWIESEHHKLNDTSHDVIFISEMPWAELPDPTVGMEFLKQKLAFFNDSYQYFELNRQQAEIIL